MLCDHLIFCHPYFLLPSIFPSIRFFSNELTLHQVSKVLELQLQYQFSNEYSALISFSIDWFNLLAVQGTLKSLVQHYKLKAILQHSAFFMFHLLHLYMTAEKNIALTMWTFVRKMMSLLFNMLSRLAIAFLLISKSLNFMAAVTIWSDFGAQEKKVCHCFHCFPMYFLWSDGTRCSGDLVLLLLLFLF